MDAQEKATRAIACLIEDHDDRAVRGATIETVAEWAIEEARKLMAEHRLVVMPSADELRDGIEAALREKTKDMPPQRNAVVVVPRSLIEAVREAQRKDLRATVEHVVKGKSYDNYDDEHGVDRRKIELADAVIAALESAP